LETTTVSIGTSSVIDHIEVFLKEIKEVKQTSLSAHITFDVRSQFCIIAMFVIADLPKNASDSYSYAFSDDLES